MKKLYLTFLTLLLISVVRADIDIELNADSGGGDITIETNPNSGTGETTYILNGINLDNLGKITTYVPESPPDGIDYYLQSIYNIFMTYNHEKWRWEITPLKSLEGFKLKFRMIFDYYFVPRTEMMEMINEKESEINQLRLEIMAMQELIPEEELCQARIDIVKKLNLTSTTCGNTIYYNHFEGNKFVGLHALENAPQDNMEESEEPRIYPPKLDNARKENWIRLCDNGVEKYCVLLQQYGLFHENATIEVNTPIILNNTNKTTLNIVIITDSPILVNYTSTNETTLNATIMLNETVQSNNSYTKNGNNT